MSMIRKICLSNIKSNDVCDKDSASVLYDTLLDGTAIIGREDGQAQRLNESDVAPLTAVGTFVPLFHKVTKVVERFLRTLPIFRAVALATSVLILVLGMVNESRAACDNGMPWGYMKDGECEVCPNPPGTACHWDGEKVVIDGCLNGYFSCGGSCKYLAMTTSATCGESTGNLTPTGCSGSYVLCGGRCKFPDMATGATCDENTGEVVPTGCQESDGYFLCGGSCKRLVEGSTSATCDESTGNLIPTGCNASYILCGGRCNSREGMIAFPTCDESTGKLVGTRCNASYSMICGRCINLSRYNPTYTGATCDESTGEVVATGCRDYYGIIYKLKDGRCISGSCGEGYVEGNHVCHKIPDGCSAIRATDGKCTKCSSGFVIAPQGACMLATECKNGLHEDNGACVANTIANCNTESNGKCSECINGTLEQDGKCVSSCDSGYKDMGGFCNRVRYTPAEAAAATSDDNNNVVTITFKK